MLHFTKMGRKKKVGKTKQKPLVEPSSEQSEQAPATKLNQPKDSRSSGAISWYVVIAITLVAFAFSYLITTSILIEDHHGKRTQELNKQNKHPLPCDASNYIAEVPVPGLHLVCFDIPENKSTSKYTLNVYRNSFDPIIQFEVSLHDSDPFAMIRNTLETALHIQNTSVNAWAMFSPTGDRIDSMQNMLSEPTSLVYEGGSFIWPGVKVGHEQRITLDQGNSVVMETLSLRPLIFSIKDFLSHSECDYIQKHAGPHMAQSGVSLMDKDVGKKATEWRTSETYFMASKKHVPLQDIDQRVAALTKVPTSHQELVQVLKYGNGQKYDAHHDYFDPRLYTKDRRTLQMIQNGKTNRMATILWYLSDVEGGGHTIFPQFGGVPPPRNMASCDQGLKVKPEKGKVIMFYSLTPDGKIDKNSLHGSCPVEGSREKWAANKWVWSSPMTEWGITN